MSEELAAGNGGMFDNVSAIQNLNEVEGFDPRKYMRLISEEGKNNKLYLDVAFRKLWFRLKYPDGKIVKQVVYRTDRTAIVEARVYLNRNDEKENFVANAFAQKYLTEDELFGTKFLELAETAAVGRALADAGFGIQFADQEGDIDPEVTDAPFDASIISEDPKKETVSTDDAMGSNSNSLIKGKTLGQVAIEKPSSLEWYVSSYGGPDNLLRAAAKYLMDTALQKAS